MRVLSRWALALGIGLVSSILYATSADARVIRIEILKRESAFGGERFGAVGAYERIVGRVFGELDPNDRRNAGIQDIGLAPRNARGMVEYVASFTILRPIDASAGNHVLLQDIVNRRNRLLLAQFDNSCRLAGAKAPACFEEPGDGFLFRHGYTILWSGWQGDLPMPNRDAAAAAAEAIRVPVARNRDGSPITGPVLARWEDLAAGTRTLSLAHTGVGGIDAVEVGGALPLTLDTHASKLETHTAETPNGVVSGVEEIPSTDWAWGDCTRAEFPGVRDSTKICLRAGADPKLLYQLTYTAKDPLVMTIGLAALRDAGSFFRYAAADDGGTTNPLAGTIQHVIATGESQSGNVQRDFIDRGFNEDDSGAHGRIVWDGSNPHIAVRRLAINYRFARPTGGSFLYEPGSEGALWWAHWPDPVRGRPAMGLLDRCQATSTCPKIFETLGSAEFWGLRGSPDFVGTDGRDIPLPDNVRRYYFPGARHGGGSGDFTLAPPRSPACVLLTDEAPEWEQLRALLIDLTDWVAKGTTPPASRYPRLADATLTTPDDVVARFPRIPGDPGPAGLLNPFLDYEFGSGFDPVHMRGTITQQPPVVRRVLSSWVPQIDQDGNELAGVKSVLFANPIGTYTGWNVSARGFTKGESCGGGLIGGFVPFARTRAERIANGDPRPSLEERYGDEASYLRRVEETARRLVAERLLLPEDAKTIVQRARNAEVFRGKDQLNK